MSTLVFFAGIGLGVVVGALLDQFKMYNRNTSKKSGKAAGYDSEGRYYEE